MELTELRQETGKQVIRLQVGLVLTVLPFKYLSQFFKLRKNVLRTYCNVLLILFNCIERAIQACTV